MSLPADFKAPLEYRRILSRLSPATAEVFEQALRRMAARWR
jgi:hypothetical protein